jgi:D-glycero-alpha-D-manno-heptose-7-phosphate kinase
VGLLNLLAAIDHKKLSPEELAQKSIEIERKKLNEAGGWQDQYHAAYGGFRSYTFTKNGVQVSKNFLESEQLIEFANYFSLVPVGNARASEEIQSMVEEKIKSHQLDLFEALSEIANKSKIALMTVTTAEEAYSIVSKGMRESWTLKKQLSSAISPSIVDECISIGLSVGADSAKLCGAGGSGFVLFAHDPKIRQNLQRVFGGDQVIPVRFSEKGSETSEFA